MTETIKVALIAAAPGFVTGLATLISSMKNAKTLQVNSVKITEIHTATNGINAALVAATATAEHAKGMQQQRDDDKAIKDAQTRPIAP